MRLIQLLCILIIATIPVSAEVKTRTVNNGMLVMEDVPDIPQEIVNELSRYQNVRSAPFRGFAANDMSILITTRFGDVSQLHRVDMAGGARHQLTFFDEPIGSVSPQPGADRIAFTMDAGGSEYAQIFMFDPATGKSTMMTDGESRNGAIAWSSDGGQMAYQSTRRNGRSNDIWIMNPDAPEDASLLLESDNGSWWGPSGWSDDNKKLIVLEYVSANHSNIFMVDVENKTKALVIGTEDTLSSNFGLGFDQDNQGIFFTTNQFSDFRQLAHKDLNTGKITVITEDIRWDVSEFELSNDKNMAAFTINENGYSSLFLLDTSSFKYTKIDNLPIGILGSLAFNNASTRLGFTLNTPQTPSDTYLMTLDQSMDTNPAIERWTYSEVGGLNTDKFSVPEVISYKTFDDRDIPAFVYKPENTNSEKLPVVIVIHGGPEGQARPSFASTYQLWMDYLGVAVIRPNVRGSAGYGKEYLQLDNGFKREDSVKDIGALLDWIEQQPDLDSDRVAVFGGSYGGYMVLASSVFYSDRLKAAVDIVGISNFVTFLENTKSYRRDLRRVEYGDERDPAMRAHLENISPNNHVDKINVPMFVVQGQNDPRVPVTEAEQIVKALRGKDKQVWYMNALNEGHGYRKKENRDVYTQAVVLFFDKYLVN